MASNKALQAKEKGNKLFKDGHLAESRKLYEEAEKLDPKNAVYPSNISAVLYELGDYAGCAEAILRSWALKPSEDMSQKLSTRLPKALNQGVQDGTIPLSVVQQNSPAINELEKSASMDNSDTAQTWKAWKKRCKELPFWLDLSREARVRLSKMPIFKGMPDPTLTYFVFGTDAIISLVNDWGPDNIDPIKLRSLSKEEISKLSFLIAGVGDGRHAFGTVLGLGKAHEKLKAPHKNDMKVHLTLLDIHCASIARCLLLFLLIDQLMADDLDPTARVEIRATLVYTCIGWVMPSYCHERLMNTCKDAEFRLLQDPPNLPSWIHVDKNTIRPIIHALDVWRNSKGITSNEILSNLKHASAGEHIQKIMNSGYAGVRESMRGQRTEAEHALKHLMGDADLVKLANALRWPKGSVTDYRNMIKQKDKKDQLLDLMMMAAFDKNIDLGLGPESLWYKQVPAFVPPAELLDRHPGFELFFDSASFEDQRSAAKLRQLRTSVLTSWKPNATIFDPAHEACVSMDLDAFCLAQEIAHFGKKNGVQVKGSDQAEPDSWTAFSYVGPFFDDIVKAVQTMKGSLQLELICGEVNSELSKIESGTDSRPQNFPKKFSRAWLSNIPDYTSGTLSTVIHVLPSMQEDANGAGVTSNCMFNSPVWKNDDEFCYNYTLLLPSDLERYLGIKTLNGKAVQDVLTLAPGHLPRPLNALASRENLYSWLSRLLLSFVCPGMAQVRPNTVKLPLNLVSFIKLLVELRHIGYPSHWLSDFLNSVLSGVLHVDHMVYKGNLPRPQTERYQRVALHRVRLDPWYAELETILASTRHTLPFALQLPEGFITSSDEIGFFKADVRPNMMFSSPMAFPGNDNVIALLFYKNLAELQVRAVNSLLSDLPAIVDGKATPVQGTFHIFTTQECVDLSQREVRWKMPKALATKMRREKWSMILFRTDFYCSTTEECPASAWHSVEAPI